MSDEQLEPKDVLQRAKLDLRDVAEAAGIGYDALRSYATGRRRMPDEHRRKAAKFLRGRAAELADLADALDPPADAAPPSPPAPEPQPDPEPVRPRSRRKP